LTKLYTKKSDKRVKIIDKLVYFAHIINYPVKVLNEKLNVQAEQFLFECHNGFKRAHLAAIHYLV